MRLDRDDRFVAIAITRAQAARGQKQSCRADAARSDLGDSTSAPAPPLAGTGVAKRACGR